MSPILRGLMVGLLSAAACTPHNRIATHPPAAEAPRPDAETAAPAPSLYEAYLAARSLQHPNERIRAAREILRQDPSFAPAHVLIGWAHGPSAADSAKLAAQQALAIDSLLPEAIQLLGNAEFWLGRPGADRELRYRLDRLLENSRALGYTAWIEGRLDEAYRWLDAGAEAHPEADWSLRYRAKVARSLGLTDEAERLFQRLVPPDTTQLSSDVWELGITYFTEGDDQKARAVYQQFAAASDRQPDAVGPALSAGHLALLLGDETEARVYLRRGMDALGSRWIQPTDFGAQLSTMLGYLLQKQGEEAEAAILLARSQETAEEMIGRGDRTWVLPLDLAAVHAIRGDTAQAFENLRAAVDAGFRDHALLSRNPLFASLSQEPGFQRVLDDMEARVTTARQSIGRPRE